METGLFKILGQIAGIAGIVLGVVLLLFREVIRKNIFSKLTKKQTYTLFCLIIVLVFIIAIVAILKNNNQSGLSPKVFPKKLYNKCLFKEPLIAVGISQFDGDNHFSSLVCSYLSEEHSSGKIFDPKPIDKNYFECISDSNFSKTFDSLCISSGMIVSGKRSLTDELFYCKIRLHNFYKRLNCDSSSNELISMRNPDIQDFRIDYQAQILVNFIMAIISFKQNDFEKAEKLFKQCINQNKNKNNNKFLAICHSYLGNIYYYKKDNSGKAIQEYLESFTLYENDEVLKNIIDYYKSKGDYNKAKEYCNKIQDKKEADHEMTSLEELEARRIAGSTSIGGSLTNLQSEKQGNVNKTTGLLDSFVLCKVAPINRTLLLENHLLDSFVLLKGDTFIMGSPVKELGRHDEETQHKVIVSDFCICKCLVTIEEYGRLTGKFPSQFKHDNKCPVESISWFDAIKYCNLLNKKAGLGDTYDNEGNMLDTSGRVTDDITKVHGFRLPTEAEWEYACRAGTSTPFNTGENLTAGQANYNSDSTYNNNPNGKATGKTKPVGSYPPNKWGLFDMHGNVLEWCSDWYDPNYYFKCNKTGTFKNPAGPVTGTARVFRGGSWSKSARDCRAASRYASIPKSQEGTIGFRVVFVP